MIGRSIQPRTTADILHASSFIYPGLYYPGFHQGELLHLFYAISQASFSISRIFVFLLQKIRLIEAWNTRFCVGVHVGTFFNSRI